MFCGYQPEWKLRQVVALFIAGKDETKKYRAVKGNADQRPSRIVLGKDMVKDHLLPTYQNALEECLEALDKNKS